MAALLALLAAAIYGVADFCGGIATRRSSVLAAAILSQGSGLLALVVLAPLLPGALQGPAALGWSAGAGLAGSLGLALLYYGLARGPVSVVAPVTGVCSIAVPVLVGLGLGERPGAAPLAGIALAVLAVALIGQAGPGTGPDRGGLDRTVAVALASGVAIGLFLVALARTGRDAGLWPLVVARAVALVALAALARAARRPLAPPPPARRIAAVSGLLDVLANCGYLIAVREGPLGLIGTLVSLYPASTVLLARLLLRERIRPVQSLGLACAVLAVVLIAVRPG